MISKSENFQAKFGQGVCSTYVNDSSKDYGKVVTGTLDTKGQFFGYNDGTHEVKAFYCEKLWGNRWDRLVGYICDNGTIKVKMSPPYNLTGKDYTKVGTACKDGGYQKDTLMTRYGRFVKSVGGSASTYRCCYYWINVTIVAVALVAKIIGCGITARLCGFCGTDSLKIGVGMMTRGEVALIVSQKGLSVGMLDPVFFTPVILLIIVSSILTPIILKILYREKAVKA